VRSGELAGRLQVDEEISKKGQQRFSDRLCKHTLVAIPQHGTVILQVCVVVEIYRASQFIFANKNIGA